MIAPRHYELLDLPVDWTEDTHGTNFFVPDYNVTLSDARLFAARHRIKPARLRKFRVGHFGIDFALTFCRYRGELTLYPGAMNDVNRLRRHLLRNARVYTNYELSMDAHPLSHIGNRINWVNAEGRHPETIVQILPETLGKDWFLNPDAAFMMFGHAAQWDRLLKHVTHLVKVLAERGMPLTIWPFHGVLGGIDSCIVPSLFQDVLFASICSGAFQKILTKGVEPLWEEYSPFSAGVPRFFDGRRPDAPNADALLRMMAYDMLVLSGEAISHCVKMALLDFILYAEEVDPLLLKRIYLLEDCTSPVPGFESDGIAIIEKARSVGIHIVSSETPIVEWPDVNPAIFEDIRAA